MHQFNAMQCKCNLKFNDHPENSCCCLTAGHYYFIKVQNGECYSQVVAIRRWSAYSSGLTLLTFARFNIITRKIYTNGEIGFRNLELEVLSFLTKTHIEK